MNVALVVGFRESLTSCSKVALSVSALLRCMYVCVYVCVCVCSCRFQFNTLVGETVLPGAHTTSAITSGMFNSDSLVDVRV